MDRAHPGFVTAVVFHPDRRRLFSASVDGTVNVWDLETASLVDRWECHAGGVNALAVDPAERWLLTAGRDRTVARWALDDGGLIGRFGDLPAGALDVAALAGGRVAAACFDGSTLVWERDGRLRTRGGHAQAVTAVCPIGDGRVVSGSRDRTLHVWDFATDRVVTLAGHTDWVTRVGTAGSHDIVSAGEDGRVIRWRAADGGVAWSLDVFRDPVWGLACDAVGTRALVGAAGATWLVDLTTGAAEPLDDLGDATFRAIAFDPEGGRVALGGDQGELLVYDGPSMTDRRTLAPAAPEYLSMAAATGGRAVLGRSDGAVELVRGTARDVVARAHGVFVYSSRRLSDELFATGGFDGTVWVWQLSSGAHTRIDYGSPVFSLSAPGSADRLLIAGGSRIELRDIAGRAAIQELDGQGAHVFAAIDRSGARVAAVGEDDVLRIWTLGGDTVTWALPDDRACAVEWIPGGRDGATDVERFVAVATPHGRVYAVDTTSGGCRLLHAAHEDWVRQLRASPDGRYVASVSQNGRGALFDLENDTLTVDGHLAGRVTTGLDVTPGGEIIVADSEGRLARLVVDP